MKIGHDTHVRPDAWGPERRAVRETGSMTTAERASHTTYRVCPLCEATCGLELTVSDGAISGVRGDHDDVFSKGFICPKGAAIDRLDNDPDR